MVKLLKRALERLTHGSSGRFGARLRGQWILWDSGKSMSSGFSR